MAETLILDLILLGLAFIVAIACVMMRNLLASAAMLAIYSLLMSIVWTNMYALDVAFTEAAVGAGISTILMIGALVITGTKEKVQHPVHWPALILVVLVGLTLAYGSLQLPAFGDLDAPIHNYVYDVYTNQDLGKPKQTPLSVPGEWEPQGDPDDPEKWRSRQAVNANLGRLIEQARRADHTGGHAPQTPGEPQTKPKDGHAHGHAAHADDHRQADGHDAHDDHDGHHGDFSHHSPNLVTAVLASYRGFDTMFETAVIFTAGISVILLLRRREEVIPPGTGGKDAAGDKPDDGDKPHMEVGP